jgi:subtilisin
MKKLLSFIMITLLLVPVSMGQETLAKVDPEVDRYILFFDRAVDGKKIESSGAKIVRDFPIIHAATVEIQPNQVPLLYDLPYLKKIAKDQSVKVEGQSIPWSHQTLNVPDRPQTSFTGKGVKIAIVDTGVSTNHPDLLVRGGDCVLEETGACDQSYEDIDGHGTHVAGIIAALDNDIGVVGIAPEAEIYAVKSLGNDGTGTSTTIMSGINWAIENKVDIINLSLTTPYEDFGIKSMVDKAVKNGIMVIAAAGNVGTFTGNSNTVQYPAKYANVIAVAATNRLNQRISTSSTGEEVDFAAPGDAIYSTAPGGGYATMRGTSMAAPHVTGLAALYMEKYPEATSAVIRKLLESNAKDIGEPGRDTFYGVGLAQFEKSTPEGQKLTYTADTTGKVSLNVRPILEKYGSYNVYRNDTLLLEEATDSIVIDFASQGFVTYKINPVENGIENQNVEYRVNAVIQAPYFSDMNNEIWYNRYLVFLYSEKILTGYGKNSLRPGQLVTRAEAVTMLGRALKLNGATRPTRFKDVPQSSFASGYIEAAAEMGILKGKADGSFQPNQLVTRAEMAILLARAYNLQPFTDITFLDVNSSIAGHMEISALAGAKITDGYADGTFKPGESMNRANFGVFLAKAQDYFK